MSKFSKVATEIGDLVTFKNACYGDSFAKCGEFLRLLWPNGIAPEQYGDALAMVRIFDKQMRIATAKDALGESPYRDIAGYGILGAVKDAAEAARGALANDAAHKAPSLCDSEGLDFSLPSIILEGTAEDCRQKHREELSELRNEAVGSTRFLVEAWDTLQSALTWKERCGPMFSSGASMAVLQAEKLLGSFTDFNKTRHAKTLALVKNAERNYYAPEVCKIILESNGERWW